ncbi:hypothetical protein HNY73_003069 [Argiope bruennichi]|uniref:Uncharacterized protein n=1 Tax=Argiope bruennichi TaxID=94029 RepID=A0A8T0FWU8_ARGBR|nr:hypothetical protein HNY73_003069 [Argiope bruennichi]
MEMEARMREMEVELEKKKIEEGMAASNASSTSGGQLPINPQIEISKPMPTFDGKECYIVLYMSLFERQVKKLKIDKENCLSCLIHFMLAETIKSKSQDSSTSNAFSRDNRDYNGILKQTKQDKGLTRNEYEPKSRSKFTYYFCGVDGHVKKFCLEFLNTNSDQDSRRKANVHRTVVDPESITTETAAVAKVMSHRQPSLDKGGNMIHQEVLSSVVPTLVDDVLLPPEIRNKLQGVQENYFVDTSEENIEPKKVKNREFVDETSDDNSVVSSEEIKALAVENSEKDAEELSRSDDKRPNRLFRCGRS